MAEKKKLLVVENLCKYFPIKTGFLKTEYVQAVENVSFFINEGETLGIVGESGCGKTTMGRSIIRLIEPTSGKITYDGNVIFDQTVKNSIEMKPYRKKMQIIFQDPSASLDPRMTVGETIGEALQVHRPDLKGDAYKNRIKELLEEVGLNTEHANRFPHEFSGGQQQRIGIARALAVEPEFIVCDEPISALDVSIQAQIVNMLEDLQKKEHLTYLFIAHDISVVRHISNKIAVMYLGQMVEMADSYDLCSLPLHPYTKSLISAVPLPDPVKTRANKRIVLEGDVPSPLNPPTGCRFHTRCPFATDKCKNEAPKWKKYGEGHYCACHEVDKNFKTID